MTERLRLKTDKVPSYFNDKMVKWLVIGLIIPVPFVAPITGVLGAIKGKEEMQQDLVSGKPVSNDQSIFNVGMLSGGYLGLIAAGLASAYIAPVAGVAALAGGAYYAYASGKATQNERLAEYNLAVKQQEHGIGIGQERSQEIDGSNSPERTHTITPEEAELLESRLKQSGQGNRSFVEELEAQQSAGLQQSK